MPVSDEQIAELRRLCDVAALGNPNNVEASPDGSGSVTVYGTGRDVGFQLREFWTLATSTIPALLDEVQALRAERDALLAELALVEWSDRSREAGEPTCPVCGRGLWLDRRHSPTCRRGRLLGRPECQGGDYAGTE